MEVIKFAGGTLLWNQVALKMAAHIAELQTISFLRNATYLVTIEANTDWLALEVAQVLEKELAVPNTFVMRNRMNKRKASTLDGGGEEWSPGMRTTAASKIQGAFGIKEFVSNHRMYFYRDFVANATDKDSGLIASKASKSVVEQQDKADRERRLQEAPAARQFVREKCLKQMKHISKHYRKKNVKGEPTQLEYFFISGKHGSPDEAKDDIPLAMIINYVEYLCFWSMEQFEDLREMIAKKYSLKH